MPSLPPAYLYTFVALLAVSSLLVLSFIAYTGTVRFSSELRQLKELGDRIVAKSIELVNLCRTGNTTVQSLIEVPTMIGHKQYWLLLQNDSQSAWLDSGFGDSPAVSSDLRLYISGHVISTGSYVAGYGAVMLVCNSNGSTVQLHLGGQEG